MSPKSTLHQEAEGKPHDSSVSQMATQKCKCGIPAKVMRSWTLDHPGRRFYACKNSVCGFSGWYDRAPVCEWQRVVANELVTQKNLMEHEVTFLRDKVAMLAIQNAILKDENATLTKKLQSNARRQREGDPVAQPKSNDEPQMNEDMHPSARAQAQAQPAKSESQQDARSDVPQVGASERVFLTGGGLEEVYYQSFEESRDPNVNEARHVLNERLLDERARSLTCRLGEQSYGGGSRRLAGQQTGGNNENVRHLRYASQQSQTSAANLSRVNPPVNDSPAPLDHQSTHQSNDHKEISVGLRRGPINQIQSKESDDNSLRLITVDPQTPLY